jgi:Domain of unknown function (DUF4279)
MSRASGLATSTMKTDGRTGCKAFVTLRFAGDELDPREISAVLPVTPTRAHRKGEEFVAGQHAGNLLGRTGIWFLATDKLVHSDELGDHLAFVEKLLYPKTGNDSRVLKLRDVLERTHSRAHITCFWRGERGESVPELGVSLKSAAKSLHAEIETDFSILRSRTKRAIGKSVTKIHRFEISSALRGGVYCLTLDLNFPILYRVVQNVSREQLDEVGATDEQPGSYVRYTISERIRFLGSTERTVARGIIDAGAPSLVIRWHPNEELAAGYLDALADISDPDDWNGELCRSEDGLFTLAERPTHRDWPGPLVIYLADCPTGRPHPFDTDIWYIAFKPNGTLQRLPDYEVPGVPDNSKLRSGARATKITQAR